MAKCINQIKKYLSSCLYCGSWLVQGGHLCSPCFEAMETLRLAEPVSIKPFWGTCLYKWTPGQSDILSHLILLLKGNRSREQWGYYAQRFVRLHIENIKSFQSICIVPAPARSAKKQDHASLWAEALAKTLKANYLPCLRKKTFGHQRHADRGDRALIEMELLENNTLGSLSFPIDLEKTLWIFADDIVTTGATARAAHIALGRPRHFVVWALAYRSLYCGVSMDLLYNSDAKTNQSGFNFNPVQP